MVECLTYTVKTAVLLKNIFKNNNFEVKLKMKMLKTILFSVLIAVSMGAVTTASACEGGRVCISPSDAIDLTASEAATALKAIEAGASDKEIIKLLKETVSLSSEINANDVVSRNTSRANKHIKAARKAVRKGDLEAAKAHIVEGIAGYKKLKGML